ncbi:MurR/RpiR family transcriptional regulator [Aquincola sp. S2]|uniref:MurR/RpiR family transcriptional regulator n=1 Tax=Pseudaquabacterium terrae TaxID=2732868 RepID=A0ABX2EQF3_9BURK|nr:MurR/RpiR family transcriptional regulator [Aquabacterium terrae]NRF70866.1 MurR/RpiR family transcriptional regulator [Aquabacterium terrae]
MTPAGSYEELKGVISSAFPTLSKQQQRIARFALENPHELALGTVAALAEATEVQPSAMVRFANALGYRGFSEMQQVFRGHLVERSGSSYRERIDQLRRKQFNGGGTPGGVLHQLVGDAVADLGQLEEGIRAADLQAAVTLIARAERIHVLAQRRAFPVACYLAYALGRLELPAQLLDGVGGMLRDGLRLIGARDVLIVASFRPYSPEVLEAAQACAARKVPVIALTDAPLSPLQASARVCFEIADDSSRPFRSLVAPLCLAQALVVSTGHRLAEQGSAKPAARTAKTTRTSKQASAS